MIRRLIRKIGYKVTMVDRRPFGVVTIRFLEPKNIIGYIDSWLRTLISEGKDDRRR